MVTPESVDQLQSRIIFSCARREDLTGLLITADSIQRPANGVVAPNQHKRIIATGEAEEPETPTVAPSPGQTYGVIHNQVTTVETFTVQLVVTFFRAYLIPERLLNLLNTLPVYRLIVTIARLSSPQLSRVK